ncbi:MAG TPA: segregation/condensation protein A [Bryobacteraceae bacterium]|nr:segregation/condensation protein A [Bryobacteraceae bacterium]
MSSQPLNFQLESYEGPLDLLLDLIRKNQVNIYDIPIAQITSQYMEYMAKAAALDMELSSDFIYMAATLIHIKSKLLLPKDPELEKLSPEEDPRQELVERLVEHQKYKDAAEMLQQKRLLEEAAWSNPQIRQFLTEDEVLNPGLDVSLFDLVKTFQAVLERAKNRPIYEVGKEDVNVPDMIRFLRDALTRGPRSQLLSVTELFERQRSRRAILCLFLAILELVKRQAIYLQQKEAFSDILVRAAVNFEEALGSDQAIAAAEQEYN